ncbi:MAG: DUF1499 domain-containing protein [Acidobacteriota bacterium]|jgi:uncharacterized protein (DUF1499 family)
MTDADPEHTPGVSTTRRILMQAAPAGFVLALVCLAGAIASGLGYRSNWWSLNTALTVLGASAVAAVFASVLCFVGLAANLSRRRGYLACSVIGLFLGIMTFGYPLRELRLSYSVPPIHDITTDTVHPPQFKAVLKLRKNAPDSTTYGGESVARLQEKAYPYIRPALYNAPPDEVFTQALKAAHSMKWKIDAVDRKAGRIEATATTFWFGFKDDVVVRIKPSGEGGTRVDVRSESRVGRSDLGANAKRIQTYLSRLTERMTRKQE